MSNNQDEPLGLVNQWIATDKGMGHTLAGSAGFFRIRGFEELTFLVKSSALPMLKSSAIEGTTSMGDKTQTPSQNQTLNELSFTLVMKSSLVSKQSIECIQTSGINGKLQVEFYVGNSQFEKPQLWGYGTHGLIKIEEGVEIDAESTESPMTLSGTLVVHYTPPMPQVNENARAGAIQTLNDLLSSKGTGVEC